MEYGNQIILQVSVVRYGTRIYTKEIKIILPLFAYGMAIIKTETIIAE